ncbi:MAG: hypothetical protein SFU99_11795 [Saprospiraceae bacterium]|nr:hypothetical protein [Saprospiraceae bacterium]
MTSKSDAPIKILRGAPQMLLNDFFADTLNKVQEYVIDAARFTMIVGKKGIRFSFDPGSFLDANDVPVRGEVQIQLCEMFDKGEMILNNLMTTSENRLLESAGQFFIKATQNLEPLTLLKPVKVEVPVQKKLSNAVASRLFEGSFASILPFNSNRIFDWKLLQTKPLKIRKISDRKYFHFTIKRFNWFSCQYFYTKKPIGNMVSARCLSDVEYFDDQAAFIVFRDIHAVAPMYFINNKFSTFNIPSNLAASIVIIGLKDQQLFLGQHQMDRTFSRLVSVQMEAVSKSRMLDTLRSL